MAQQAHTTLTDTPVDLATVYTTEGRYIAQVVVQGVDTYGALYATADVAPVADADYFHAPGRTFFTFCVDGETHTWAKSALAYVDLDVVIAVNRYAD